MGAGFNIKAQTATNGRSSRPDIAVELSRPDELQWLLPVGACKVVEPLLSLLAQVDGVEQIGARVPAAFGTDRAKVWDRQLLDRWLG